MADMLAIAMFAFACLGLMGGYNVAFTLSGVSLIFAALGVATGTFEAEFLLSLPGRIYPLITREILMAVPLFVFMGVMLEKSRIAEDLLESMGDLFGPLKGGLGISVVFVGALLAASTGIVGATVVTMGLLSLPTMLKRNYAPSLASGSIAASGTLGQIIPPSIVLVILGCLSRSTAQFRTRNDRRGICWRPLRGSFTARTYSRGLLCYLHIHNSLSQTRHGPCPRMA